MFASVYVIQDIMKKIKTLLLLFAIGCFLTIGSTVQAKQTDEELERIASYNLFSASDFKDLGQPITDKVYYAAIKKYIKPYGKNAQKKFDSDVKSSLSDGNPLTYQDVFNLTFLTALATNTTYLTQINQSEYYYTEKNIAKYWEMNNRCNEAYTKQAKSHYFYYTPWRTKEGVGWPMDGVVMFFNRIQTSQLSGAALFMIDGNQDLTFFSSNCPKDVAIRMLGRLYESSKPVQWDMESAEAKAIYQKAAERRQSILNSPSVYPSNGKVYYVSTSGNDDNNGLSEQKPWKTLGRASVEMEPGSVVLFKRGDIWRGESLFGRSDVTYSAYGTGPKPAFYGDGEDGGNPDNWELSTADSTGTIKVWKYKKELYDVGGIIFNDGESYAVRKQGWWKDTKWVDFDDDRKDLTPTNVLTEDLTFISVPDLSGMIYPISFSKCTRRGPVYLRCDKGNPADVYKQINFEQSTGDGPCPITLEKNSTVDNIAVKYFGELGITTNFSDEKTEGMSMIGDTVTNCEVGFGGNITFEMKDRTHDEQKTLTGDGIYGLCNGATIRGNYIHDVDCGGIRIENSGKFLNRKINYPMTVTGNLLERNGQGIWLSTVGGKISYKKIIIDDNMFMDNGQGWVHGGGWEVVALSTDNMAESECMEMIISNNVAYNAKGAIFDSVGKNMLLSNNHFYMCDYGNDTHIKGNLIYVLDKCSKTANVIALKKHGSKRVTIPDSIKVSGIKYTVSNIADYAFYKQLKLTKISIKASKLKKIGKKSFALLSKNTKVSVLKSKKKVYSGKLRLAGFNGKIS